MFGMITLDVKPRDSKTSLYKIREEGFVPAVFYGPKEKSASISISAKEFDKVWKKAGESSVIVLKGEFGEHEALIHDIDRDPVTDKIKHADFYVIEKGKKIKVSIPIEFIGVSPAVKDLGGVLVKVIHEVEIESMPKDLPHSLVVDISALVDFNSQITAKDIKLPSGVLLTTKPDEIIVLASMPKEEKEEDVKPLDLSAIEVEKKGKVESAEDAVAGDVKSETKAK
jgi:large subunit ribosomal protein L25